MANLLRALPDLNRFDGLTGLAGASNGTAPTFVGSPVMPPARLAYSCATVAGSTSFVTWQRTTALGTTLYLSVWAQWTALFSAFTPVTLYDTSFNPIASIGLSAAFKPQLSLWVNGTQTQQGADGAVAVTAGLMHRFDIVIAIPASGATTITGNLDGTQFATGTGTNTTNLAAQYVAAGNTFGGTSQTVFVGAVVLNDSTGTTGNALASAPQDIGAALWTNGMVKDQSNLVVTTAPGVVGTWQDGFVRDSNGNLCTTTTVSGCTWQDGFMRDVNGLLLTVPYASAVISKTMTDGYLLDANFAVITVTTALAAAPLVMSNAFLRDANLALLIE